MVTLYFVMMLAAVGLFVFAAVCTRPNGRGGPDPLLLTCLGLAVWAAVPMIQYLDRL